jgi:hypothetical protein
MSRIILPGLSRIILPGPRIRGFFKLEAHSLSTGRTRLLADWFPNLITDAGLNRIGTGSYLSACHVGTSNSAPNVLDTTVGGYLAGTTTRQADTYGAQATPPYYGWRLITYRFPLGAVVGNVASVATATAAANGGSTILFSRALVLDELGDPTTVTVQADEVLDVTYECRLYPMLTDYEQAAVDITGSGTHDIIVRASSVTSASNWGQFIGGGMTFNPYGSPSARVTNGVIGAITSSPSGTSLGSLSISNASYSNNSLERAGTMALGLNQGNLSGGIRSWSFATSVGSYQMQFTPAIAKNNTRTLSLTAKVSWARNP